MMLISNDFSFLRAFFGDESGATAIEYGLLAASIGVILIGSVTGLGSALSGKFEVIHKEVMDRI